MPNLSNAIDSKEELKQENFIKAKIDWLKYIKNIQLVKLHWLLYQTG